MPKDDVIHKFIDQNNGLKEFTFNVYGKAYKAHGLDQIDEFMQYVYKAKRPGLNSFTYGNKEMFDIERLSSLDKSKKKPDSSKNNEPEAIQQTLKLATRVDSLADKLEEFGYTDFAYRLDVIANTLEYLWKTNRATLFFDEIANQDIKADDAKKAIDAYEKGADTEHSVSKVTGIDSWTCKKILDIAHKHGLLNKVLP